METHLIWHASKKNAFLYDFKELFWDRGCWVHYKKTFYFTFLQLDNQGKNLYTFF